MPTRHSKNNSASAVFTYRERQRTEWGRQSQRLGSDSIKRFDCCSLCLHPARDAVVCHKGHLYCKGCVYDSLMQQKQRSRAEQEEKQRRELRKAAADGDDSRTSQEALRFAQREASIHSNVSTLSSSSSSPPPPAAFETVQTSRGIAYMPLKTGVSKQLPSFWIPQLAPSATAAASVSSSSHTVCPASGHRLRLQQLRAVCGGLSTCGCCDEALTDSMQLICLYRCGHIVCARCLRVMQQGNKGKGSSAAAAAVTQTSSSSSEISSSSTSSSSRPSASSSSSHSSVECPVCGEESDGSDQVRLEGGTGFAASAGTVATAETRPAFVC